VQSAADLGEAAIGKFELPPNPVEVKIVHGENISTNEA
jgi:hypothetical protein